MQRYVAVTGVAGFGGSNLAKQLLDRGYRVKGIDNLSAGTLGNVDQRVEFHEADVRSPEIYPLFNGVDAIFHLAAKTCLPECVNNPLEAAGINVVGTLNVLEAARRANVQKFIYPDTSAKYEGIDEFPTRQTIILPLRVYAATNPR